MPDPGLAVSGSTIAFEVGARVQHLDQMPPADGRVLPMRGTVVGIEVRYVVEWDGAKQRDLSMFSDDKQTFHYPAESLVGGADDA